ncbi:MAG: WbqC family protein [Ferruginibacter sp.]
MKKILITQSNYIPWKGYFDSINTVDEFVLYDDMQYTKRDWRNRNKIKTAGGAQWLSIPVEVKGKYFQKIAETKISDKAWAKDHWATIKHSYAKAPFFKEYKDFFEDLYLNCHEELLSHINYRFLKAIMDLLKISTPMRWSNEFELRGDKSEKLLGICEDEGVTDYFSGPAAKDYLDTALFNSKNVTVNWFDYSGYPEYEQLFPPFDHAVSIIDVIFNTGADIKLYMKSFS